MRACCERAFQHAGADAGDYFDGRVTGLYYASPRLQLVLKSFE